MTDTRRKITFHLNPETSEEERIICEMLETVPRADRGRVMRAMFMTGGAFRLQDARSVNMLGELVTPGTTMTDLITAQRALFPSAFADVAAAPAPAPLATAAPEPDPAPVDETKAGMKNMFGQQ